MVGAFARGFWVLPMECLAQASQPYKEETVTITIRQIGKPRQSLLFLAQCPTVSNSEGGI